MADELLEDAPPAEVETAPEPEPFTLPEDFASQVQSWDIPVDALPDAVARYKALQTEEGVIDAFIAEGLSLGFGVKELQRLFDDEQAAAAQQPATSAPVVEEDPDRYITAAEVQQVLESVRQEQQQIAQQSQQAAFQVQQQRTFDAMDAWFTSQGITDEEERQAIARFGEKHILPGQNSYDPRIAVSALERGKAEHEAFIERQAQAYLAKKGLVAQAQPTPPGGGQTFAGDGGDDPAPNYAELRGGALKAAKERVRQRLREAGELG